MSQSFNDCGYSSLATWAHFQLFGGLGLGWWLSSHNEWIKSGRAVVNDYGDLVPVH